MSFKSSYLQRSETRKQPHMCKGRGRPFLPGEWVLKHSPPEYRSAFAGQRPLSARLAAIEAGSTATAVPKNGREHSGTVLPADASVSFGHRSLC